jgi:hypothetical protein
MVEGPLLVMKVEIPGDCGGDGGVKVDGRESIDNIAAVTRGIVDVEDAKNVVAILEVNNEGVCMVEDVGSSGGRETRDASSNVDRDASSNVDRDAGMTSCRRFEKVPGGVGHPPRTSVLSGSLSLRDVPIRWYQGS